MNYRHSFHAGNFADVVKHAVLALVLEHLKRKETPFFVLDTHAGTGLYDLAASEAERTGEWRGGIGRVIEAPPPELEAYLAVVRDLNPEGGLRWYPGSPALAARLTRPQDRLAFVELHPEDHATLRRNFARDRRVGVHHGDGYGALKALLPPAERRGLVLIDPPYESADEIEQLRRGLAEALRRWRSGVFLLWYPIKDPHAAERFHADLAMLGPPPTLVAEISLGGKSGGRLAATGLAIVNPPWQLDVALIALLPPLAEILAPGEGDSRIDWLVREG